MHLNYIIKLNKLISRCIYVDTVMSYKWFLWPVYTENKMVANMVNPRKENLETNRKLAITRLLQEIGSRFLHQTRGFRGRRIFLCKRNLSQTNPCYHGNEILEILTENLLSRLLQVMSPILAPKGSFRSAVLPRQVPSFHLGTVTLAGLSGCRPSVRAINRYWRHQPTASETVPLAGWRLVLQRVRKTRRHCL